MEDYLGKSVWGNTMLAYVIVLLGAICLWTVLKLARRHILGYIKKMVSHTVNTYDDVLIKIAERFFIPWLYLFINYNIVNRLNLSLRVEKIVDAAMMAVTAYYLVRLINFVFHRSVVLLMQKRDEPLHRIQQVDGMLLVVKALMWIVGIIMLADNLGYDVTTIIAGLGVGGIAIALAAQSILGDLFSYIVIFFDKPFEIGDFIIMDKHTGVVEKIGIKTTHVRSLDGQQLIMPNAEMAKSVIQNFKRLQRRRVVFSIGVVYYTAAQKLRSIPDLVKQIISAHGSADLDRVHFKSFGDFSINYEIVYYINSADYVLFMDIQQEICMRIFEAFEKEKIEFAFPTQTLFIARQNEPVNGHVNPVASVRN
ncbi:MAG TPA: mechanosensitive ion channel family protein [Ferruginibacter sp.]|nr:mechanosensitive ion channel family protein [Ferruginibacter sp.]